MNSRDRDFSLWQNDYYYRQLLSYINKIYGKKHQHVFASLRIQSNGSDELDQLYEVIKEIEKQPGLFVSM